MKLVSLTTEFGKQIAFLRFFKMPDLGDVVYEREDAEKLLLLGGEHLLNGT